MPLLFHEILHSPGEWGLWKIDEAESWLREKLRPHPHEEHQLATIRGEERRREYLAARLLLHHMSGRKERGRLLKDTDGKPHLENSLFFVSISHTVGFSAALAHPRPCGIDVQRIVERITHLSGKFVAPSEERQLLPEYRLVQLHLIWAAKEAMYKAYGRRQLDFRKHLAVDFGGYHPGLTEGTGSLRTPATNLSFHLNWKIYPEFVVVAAIAR